MACRQDAAKEYVLQNGSDEFILSLIRLLSQFITLHTFVPAQYLSFLSYYLNNSDIFFVVGEYKLFIYRPTTIQSTVPSKKLLYFTQEHSDDLQNVGTAPNTSDDGWEQNMVPAKNMSLYRCVTIC